MLRKLLGLESRVPGGPNHSRGPYGCKQQDHSEARASESLDKDGRNHEAQEGRQGPCSRSDS